MIHSSSVCFAPPVQKTTSSTTHRKHWQATIAPSCEARSDPMMLESAGLSKEIMKTSDHSAASLVVPRVVLDLMDALGID